MSFINKYTSYDSSKAKSEYGFTLIELLVTIIIVGLLSVMALPSFLNQVGRSRGAEAKSSLGTINRSQQAYRYENATMAPSLAELGVNAGSKHYIYSITATDSNNATTSTLTQGSDLKAYSSRLEYNVGNVEKILCESNDVVAKGTTSTLPTNVLSCSPNYKIIR